MPNLFVIGAEKCGTSSMHHYLGLHPEISMSSTKEPGYFARPSPDYRLIRVEERSRYLDLFEPGKAVRGESSPIYSAYPELAGVPERIRDETEDPKFIYLVRDPIERLESALRLWASFGRAVEPEVGGIEAIPESHMLSRCQYMTQLRLYLDYFPAESILVLDSDRLRGERREALSEVFAFLGVDPSFDHPGFDIERVSGDSLRMPPWAWRRARASRVAETAVGLAPDRLRLDLRRIRAKVSRPLGRPVPEVRLSGALADELREDFRPEVEALREFTGQDFPGWSI